MRLTYSVLAFSLALVVVNSLETVRAATFNATIGAQNYTIVEVDTFKNGDVPGNTQRADGSGTFWASSVSDNTDGLWNERAYAAFNTGYTSLPGATDRVFEASYLNNPGGDDLASTAALRTTVSGLAANKYNVFLLYTVRDDDFGYRATRAALNDVVANGSTYDISDAIGFVDPNSGWKTAIAPIGSTNPNVTGFTVDIAALADPSNERSHALAIAYQLAPAVPEPTSIMMLSVGAAACLRVARRRRK